MHILCKNKMLKFYILDETLEMPFDNEEVLDVVCSGFREGREIFDTVPGLHRTKFLLN